MELHINTPAYFNQYYGIDDEVYQFCRKRFDAEFSLDKGIIPIR